MTKVTELIENSKMFVKHLKYFEQKAPKKQPTLGCLQFFKLSWKPRQT